MCSGEATSFINSITLKESFSCCKVLDGSDDDKFKNWPQWRVCAVVKRAVKTRTLSKSMRGTEATIVIIT